ncbi:MAG: transporter substrate-binding protein [Firmicutes bacterium]|nr:transporter substrate-binding protein [Bacillota bacterium]
MKSSKKESETMKYTKKLQILVLVVILAMTLTACSSSGDPKKPAAATAVKDTLVYAIPISPAGVFHPTLQYSNYDRRVVFLVYDRLLTKGADGAYIPSLADKYEVSKDGLTYTFTLKKGIKWHDGQEFTAEDVAFTYETTCHPKFGKGYDEFSMMLLGADAYHAGKADRVEGVKVIDKYTVSFTFTKPYNAALVKFIDKPVLAKHVWGKVPVEKWNDETALLKNPIGTGPYKFVEFKPDQYVKLESNKDYFKGAPQIKNFIFKVSNADTQQSELLNGTIDIAAIASWKEGDLKPYTTAGIKIDELPGSTAEYLIFNTTDPRFADKRVRQAIIYAIDRDALVASILNKHGLISNTIMHPSQYGYPSDLNPYKQDFAKAKALLKDAGWVDSNNDGILDKDGKPFKVTLQHYDDASAPVASALQQYLKQVGIDVEITKKDFNTVLATLQNKTKDQKFDLAFMGASYRANIGYGASNFWMARYDDATSKALIQAGSEAASEALAKPIYQKWARYINEEVPMFILFFEPDGTAYNPALLNYKPVMYEWFPDVEKWTFKK